MASSSTRPYGSSTSHTPDDRVTCSNSHAIESSRSEIVGETDTTSTYWFNFGALVSCHDAMTLAYYLDTSYHRPSSPSRTSDHSAVPCKYLGLEEAPTIPPVRKTKNIVLFGEAGAGKSSVVNLMAGREVAKTSLGIQRCTLDWQDYVIDFDEESYKVFDTMGVEESGLEKKEYLAAVANAYRFIKMLDAEGGVDLLLFCVRAGRFTAALQSNYRFFHEFLCDKKVPIVLAITNLEREQRMEDWWEREHGIFARYQIHVADHACITAANGLEGTHQQFYEESRVAMRNLVKRNIAGKPNDVWTGGNKVFVALMHALKIFGKNRYIRKNVLIGQLKRCGMSPQTARQLADVIEQGEVTT